MISVEPELLSTRAGQTLIADKGYTSAEFERILEDANTTCKAERMTHLVGDGDEPLMQRRGIVSPDGRVSLQGL